MLGLVPLCSRLSDVDRAMNATVIIAVALIVAGALYIHLRWRRSPRAYRAMIALSVGYFLAGALAAAWALHSTA